MRIGPSVGTGTVVPGTENRKEKKHGANAPSPAPVAPMELCRQNLDDAISGAAALLGLLAAVLSSSLDEADPLAHSARRGQLATLCRATQYTLNEAQDEL